MYLKYFYDDKLAQASYMVGCQKTGEAIVFDPARNIEPYLDAAKSKGLRITAVAETHIHADFVSGAREMADRTDALLYLSNEGGRDWSYSYLNDLKHVLLTDGDTFNIGNVLFEVMHTPGHTPESLSYILTDQAGGNDAPMGIFSGDFVFVGDVGRPDLLEKAAGVNDSSDQSAREMFQSLQRFKQLPDYMQVWPGHGAGSACGKSLGAVPTSTVGYEKKVNWSLGDRNEDSFVKELLAGQPEPPRYFGEMKRINKEGPRLLRYIQSPQILDVSVDRMNELLEEGNQVVDLRNPEQFAEKHIRGTINIPYNKSFVNWAGWLLDYDRPLYLIVKEDKAKDVIRDLHAIGIDHIAGYVDSSILEDYREAGFALDFYKNETPAAINNKIQGKEVHLIDVRNQNEWEENHIPEARHMMLGRLNDRIGEIPKGQPVAVHCQAGGRSAIAASILKKHGIPEVINVEGGLSRWISEGLPVKNHSKG